ncbi:archaemetzincin-2 [Protopterus annectens]|uniref:archaemetzincin-2 n=1 Tax=Protopterus annectens TaxID=7888 RepID=UPI001CFA27DE|nr:archaemetzincin-2 [Protopterus annectens]
MRTIQYSVQDLKKALISEREDLCKLYQRTFSSRERHLLENFFPPDSPLFKFITIHSSSDWIPSHPEAIQDFEKFYTNPYRSTPTVGKNTIYVQPIGSFGDSAVSTAEYIQWLKEYCEAYYYGLHVKILDPVPVSDTSCTFRVNDHTQNLQIHAGDLLRYLKKKKPRDAFCTVGITLIDLYPQESWNFIFGQASLTEGIGIFSFARYDNDFYSSTFKGRLKKTQKLTQGDYSIFQNHYTPPVTSILLLRSCGTLTHEIGHIFGIQHCQWLQCVMQGSNHLEESDRRPFDLCPICLRKLQCAAGFNLAERYKALLSWIDKSSFSSDLHTVSGAQFHIQRPVEAFMESREWLLKCLQILEG